MKRHLKDVFFFYSRQDFSVCSQDVMLTQDLVMVISEDIQGQTKESERSREQLLLSRGATEWDIPKDDGENPLRKAAYIIHNALDNDDEDIGNDGNNESNSIKLVL